MGERKVTTFRRPFESQAVHCSGGLTLSRYYWARLLFQLGFVGVNDGRDQTWKTLVHFRTAGGVMHFDPSTFAPNQTCFPEGLEMERES